MKIWHGYGSEHSANLVMIGRFEDVITANKAQQVIDLLTEQAGADMEAGLTVIGRPEDRFTKDMEDLLRKVKIHSIRPFELDQLAYDATVKVEEKTVVVTTDEIDVSGFLKVLLNMGARVEVYSAHDYSDTGYGRGR